MEVPRTYDSAGRRRRVRDESAEAPAAWQDASMTDQVERFDRWAVGYVQWWAPVLAPAVGTLLDELGPSIASVTDVVDIGTGTGQLALGALERWPHLTVVGVDPSAGMSAVADAEADRRLPGSSRSRFRSVVASADAMPFADATFDLAISSFVFQLVPRRARALREARRVLRPGGMLAYVTWLRDERRFVPDRVFDDVLADFGFDEPEDEQRNGDLPSVERAAGELRHAGFAGVTTHAGLIEHRFTVDGYIAFLSEFDEESLFAELEPKVRRSLMERLQRDLGRLTPDEMTMRFPIVFATGQRTG
jgi:SAM-dependent methyltransferase